MPGVFYGLEISETRPVVQVGRHLFDERGGPKEVFCDFLLSFGHHLGIDNRISFKRCVGKPSPNLHQNGFRDAGIDSGLREEAAEVMDYQIWYPDGLHDFSPGIGEAFDLSAVSVEDKRTIPFFPATVNQTFCLGTKR